MNFGKSENLSNSYASRARQQLLNNYFIRQFQLSQDVYKPDCKELSFCTFQPILWNQKLTSWKQNQIKPHIPNQIKPKMSTKTIIKLPHLLRNEPCIIISAVLAEADDDGKVIKFLLVIRSEQIQLGGQHSQTFLLRQDTNANEVTKKPQIDPQLAQVYGLKSRNKIYFNYLSLQLQNNNQSLTLSSFFIKEFFCQCSKKVFENSE